MHCMRRGSHPPYPPFARGGKPAASGLFSPLAKGGHRGVLRVPLRCARFGIHAIENRSRPYQAYLSVVTPSSQGLDLAGLFTHREGVIVIGRASLEPPARPDSGRPPCGFWDGSASAHHMHARITASSWDTFDQVTAGPSVPLLSLTMDHISPYWYIRGVTPRRRIRRW